MLSFVSCRVVTSHYSLSLEVPSPPVDSHDAGRANFSSLPQISTSIHSSPVISDT